MLLPRTLAVPEALWLLVFGGQAVAFCWLLLRKPDHQPWQCVHHLMTCLAMAYMGFMIGRPVHLAGRPMTGLASLAVAFGTYFLVYTAWTASRSLRRPRPVDGWRVLMSGGMAYLLLAM
jgi:hypothetical protein